MAEQHEGGLQTEEDARFAAQRAFGNLTRVKEDTRAVWTARWFEDLVADLRFVVRSFVRKPGLTALIVLLLSLGTGANTAIFCVVDTVLIKPLPYRGAGQLMTVWGKNRQRGFDTEQVSAPDFADWRARNHGFSEMAASTDEMYTLTRRGTPIPLVAYSFSSNFFHVLGVQPILGRAFLPIETQPGKNQVAVLSYRLWQTRFGGNRNVVGETAVLDGVPHTIIGVMPEGVTYPGATDLWTPLVIRPASASNRGDRFLRVLARLRPGTTQAQAVSEMNEITKQLAREYPATNKEVDAANLISLRQAISGDIRSPLLLLMATVGFVLLIACANVANLLLLRGVGRRGEIAIRAAIGAVRSRLLRQLLTESLLVAFAGSIGGMLLAFASVRVLLALFPQNIANLNIPHLDRLPIGASVFGFAALVCLAIAFLFGFLPATELLRTETGTFLKEASRKIAGASSGGRLRNVLTGLEVAVSVVLLVAAGLMLKSFAYLVRGNLGIRPENVLTLRLVLPADKYSDKSKLLPFSDELVRKLRSVPGVQSASTVTFLPLSGWWGSRPVVRRGDTDKNSPTSMWSSITPDYFRTMQIPVLAGRTLSDQDAGSSAPVAVVSESLARRLFPNGNAIGQIVDAKFGRPVQIVGIVGDVHHLGMTSDLTSEIYVPFAQFSFPLVCVAIRTEGNPANFAKAVEKQVWALDSNQAVSFLMPLTDLASEALSMQRVLSALLGIFAGLALLMAVIGIFAVVSFGAAQRTHEIGVRLALGADARDVLALIAGQAAPPVLVGLGTGVVAALSLAHLLTGFLYGVRPLEPAIYVAVVAVLAGSAALASYMPARRAIRVDPTTALRYE